MDKKIVKNYIYSNIYQLVLVITPLITTPYLTRVMGAEVLSINSLTANIVQWFVIFGIMGINNYGNREIGKVREDKNAVSKTFFEIYAMQLLCLAVMGLLYFGYVNIFNHTYKIIMLIQGITLLSVALDITWFFYGVEDLKKATIRNVLVKVIGVVLIFILVKSSDDLIIFVLINTVTAVLGQFIMWFQLKDYVKFTRVKIKNVLKHLKPNMALFIPQIAISIYSVLDITMIGALYHDIRAVNFYEQSQKLVKMFLFFITSIGSVMLPRIANIYAKNEHQQIRNYLQKTFRFAIYLSIPMMFGIVTLIQNFVGWFLPPDYSVVGMMIMSISPIILFISISNVYGIQYMVPTGMTKQYSISVVCGAVINFLINLALIPNYGAYGAIIGSVTAEFVVTAIQYIFIKDKIKLSINIKSLFKVLVSSIVMGVVVYSVGMLGSNFIVNLAQVGLGLIVYVAMLVILKDDFVKETMNSLKRGGQNE